MAESNPAYVRFLSALSFFPATGLGQMWESPSSERLGQLCRHWEWFRKGLWFPARKSNLLHRAPWTVLVRAIIVLPPVRATHRRNLPLQGSTSQNRIPTTCSLSFFTVVISSSLSGNVCFKF